MVEGRWFSQADLGEDPRPSSANAAKQYGYLPGEVRTSVERPDYGIVGVLGDVELSRPEQAVFITLDRERPTSGRGRPTKVYIRSRTADTTDRTMIPTAMRSATDNRGRLPSDALKASAQADKTLQQTALFAGLLALAVGGLGIANVMSISVIQRSSEIGIRRALGHTRSTIAAQFLLEAIFVGLFGGLIGAALGVATSD